MIQEDYVSFEIAKLLKEKGFPQSTFRCHYLTDGSSYYKIFENRCGFGDNNIIAPTLAMAMKWLREVHNIFIDVHLSFAEDPEAYPAVYYVYILDAKSGNSLLEKATNIGELNPLMNISDHNVPINFDSPEEATEAAIKYCLKNLI